MEKDDKEEVRDILQGIVKIHAANMNGRFNVIHTNLVNIEKQITIANGRTKKLEDAVGDLNLQNVKHVLECPVSKEIRDIENSVANMVKDLEINSDNRFKDLEINNDNRVKTLEADILKRLQPIETNEISRKATSKFFLLMWTIVGGTLGALVFGILKFIFSGK